MSQQVKIKMKTSMAGPHGSCGAGQVISVSAEQANDLIAGGYAERVGASASPPQTETAALTNEETAVAQHKPRGKKRARRGKG